MIYKNVVSAVVSILSAESMTDVGGQRFENEPVAMGALLSGELTESDRQLVNFWMCARLKKQLIPAHWDVLVAKYSGQKGQKLSATAKLKIRVSTPAPMRFISYAVFAWALPKKKGVDSKCSEDSLQAPRWLHDMNLWDEDARPERTRRRWRKGIFDTLDDLLLEALAAAEEVLKDEGVLCLT